MYICQITCLGYIVCDAADLLTSNNIYMQRAGNSDEVQRIMMIRNEDNLKFSYFTFLSHLVKLYGRMM